MSRWLWERQTAGARLGRLSLAPAAWALRIATNVRAAMYQTGWLPRRALPLPTVAVGNLTVGGTGKTPLASWIADFCVARGVKPAILLRGYGGDETAVHRHNVPEAIVIENPDRAPAANQAAAAGAQVIVLDDAFQHLRVARDLDIVLLAAESLSGPLGTLPAGPWRERPDALARADLGIVTRKRATAAEARNAAGWMKARLGPDGPVAIARLRLARFEGLRSRAVYDRSVLRGSNVMAVAGIGDPESFRVALHALGASVDLRAFGDHHPYDARDARRLAADARQADRVVMTAKDAVKLRGLWPPAGAEPLVGVLEVHWEEGRETVERALNLLLERRRATGAPGTTTRGGESRSHQ